MLALLFGEDILDRCLDSSLVISLGAHDAGKHIKFDLFDRKNVNVYQRLEGVGVCADVYLPERNVPTFVSDYKLVS